MRTVLIVVAVVLVVVIVRLPASLLTDRMPPGPAVLAEPAGTLWQGQAQLTLTGKQIGSLHWKFQPSQLLGLRLGMTLALRGSDTTADASASLSLNRQLAMTLAGDIDEQLLNDVLAPYAIRLRGAMHIDALELAGELLQPDQAPRGLEDVMTLTALSGALAWDGGLATYTLQAGTSTTPFPPLRGALGLSGERLPQMAVYSSEVDYPLLTTTVLPEGFVKIGVSRGFTSLAGMPWPGQEPDNAIVLEVEQRVF